MPKYLIYLANVNSDCFHILSYVSTCVLIGYFSCKEMVLLFLNIELECSHLENTHIIVLLLCRFSGILCDWDRQHSAVY